MEIRYGRRVIDVPVKKVSEFGKVRGLMFRSREKAKALLFEFSKNVKMKIHSCFVFFPFVAIWLDDKNKVLEIKKVHPWKFSVSPSMKKFRKLIEIPINKKYSKIVNEFL